MCFCPLDYVFPDLTEKAGPIEDTSQGQEMPSPPSPLPKMNLVEPPWHMGPREEEEEEEEQKEAVEREEEAEEGLLPVSGPQEAAQTQAHDFAPTSSSQAPGASKHRHEDSGDHAYSGVEVGSSMEPSLLPPSVTPGTVTLGGQDVVSREAGGTVLPATGHGVEFEAPQEASEEATVGATGLVGKQGEAPSLASFPLTEAPSGAEAPDEDSLYPGDSAPFPLAPRSMELTPSSATVGQEDLSQQPQEGQAAEVQSRIPWDSTQVELGCMWALGLHLSLRSPVTLAAQSAGRVCPSTCEAPLQHAEPQLHCWAAHLPALPQVVSAHCRQREKPWKSLVPWPGFVEALQLPPLAFSLLRIVAESWCLSCAVPACFPVPSPARAAASALLSPCLVQMHAKSALTPANTDGRESGSKLSAARQPIGIFSFGLQNSTNKFAIGSL